MKKVRFAACVAAFAFAVTGNAQNVMDFTDYSKSELDSIAKVLVAERTSHTEEFATPKVFRFVENDETVNIDGKPQVFHHGDTVLLKGIKYAYDGVKIRVAPQIFYSRVSTIEVTRDEETWDKLKHASVETRFAEEMAASSGRKRDTQWYEATSGNDTLRIVKHANDKNHWYVAAQGDYQISEGCNGFGGTLEVQYWSDSFWWAAAGGSITRNMMYELAEDAGANYTSYAGHAIGGLKFDLGRRENFTLALYGGLEATWQKTNSREFSDEFGNEYMMKSTHSNYAPVAGAMVRYRFPDSRVAIFARGEWSQKAYTYQNAENERHNAFKLSAGVSIGLHGNYVRTK